VQSNVIINAEDNQGNTALTIACSKGLTNLCKYLLINGANINQQVKGNMYQTPLHFAVQQSNLQLVKLLIQHKPNLLLMNSSNKNIIDEASSRPNTEIYKLLAEEHGKRSEAVKEESRLKKENLNKAKQVLNQDSSISPKLAMHRSGSIPHHEAPNQQPFTTDKISELFKSNPVNQSHHITERDLKYAKLKMISDYNKLELTPLVKLKIDKSQSNVIKKLEAEFARVSEENSFLRLENAKFQKELKQKDAIIEIKDEEIKSLMSQGATSYLYSWWKSVI
jgi:hypothetical protein